MQGTLPWSENRAANGSASACTRTALPVLSFRAFEVCRVLRVCVHARMPWIRCWEGGGRRWQPHTPLPARRYATVVSAAAPPPLSPQGLWLTQPSSSGSLRNVGIRPTPTPSSWPPTLSHSTLSCPCHAPLAQITLWASPYKSESITH